MSAHDYTEDMLVEQPAIKFRHLGWQTVSVIEEVCAGGTPPRDAGEVVLMLRCGPR